MSNEENMDPAEIRVRAFRDEVARTAEELDRRGTIRVAELLERLQRACAAVEDDDLGADAATIRSQFEAMFNRLGDLAAQHAEPVSTSSLGLPGDARFLRDMTDYLTRRYGLEDEES